MGFSRDTWKKGHRDTLFTKKRFLSVFVTQTIIFGTIGYQSIFAVFWLRNSPKTHFRNYVLKMYVLDFLYVVLSDPFNISVKVYFYRYVKHSSRLWIRINKKRTKRCTFWYYTNKLVINFSIWILSLFLAIIFKI